MRGVAVTALLAAACQEVQIYGDLDDFSGTGDAPDLRTPRRTDTIEQRLQPKVDVLWVIDNSGSMTEEQEKVAANFEAFTRFFVDSGIDWHIGAVTTDCGTLDDGSTGGTGTGLSADCGKLVSVAGYPYITPDVPAPEAMFRQLVRAGAGGSADEMGLLATWRALVPVSPQVEQHNRGFLRKNAALHIVVISDEADSSPYPEFNMPEFTTYLRYQIKEPSGGVVPPVTFSSIVGPRPNGCRSQDGSGEAAAGAEYIEATNAIGGIFASICTTDWYPVLEAIGLQAAGLRDEYFLSQLPVRESIRVWVFDETGRRDGLDVASLEPDEDLAAACDAQGRQQCFAYRYDRQRNSIRTIDFLPAPSSDVNIRYEILGEDDGDDATAPPEGAGAEG